MVKKFFFTGIAIMTLFTSSILGEEILYWKKNQRLGYNDFKGTPTSNDTLPKKGIGANSTHTLGTISKSIDVKYANKSGKTTFTVYAGMKQNESWIKSKMDSITLKHEQGHFDICEIYTRLLRKEIKKIKTLGEVNLLFAKISEEENIEQDRYDSENSFKQGGITPEWALSIQKRLTELDAHENPIITVPIYK